MVTTITTIGYDHVAILGRSLRQIAFEKAGIIKDNVPVAVSGQKNIPLKIIKRQSALKHAEIFNVSKNFRLFKKHIHGKGAIISFKFKGAVFENFNINLLGYHQIENFFTALFSVYLAVPEIIGIIKNAGRFELDLPGRIQILNDERPIILDCAHNNDSSIMLKNALKLHFNSRRWTVLTGMAIDKDYKNFYKNLFNISCKMIITSCGRYKQADPDSIYKWMKKKFDNVLLIHDINEAYNEAMRSEGPLLITGSFYVAGPFLELYNKSCYGRNQL